MPPKKRKSSLGRPKEVPPKRLQRIASGRGTVRSGSTVDIQQRAHEYQSQGYSGELYYSRTRNMKEADKLLKAGPGRHTTFRRQAEHNPSLELSTL